ncbi:TENX-like protein [Mya arenaria]|uniref:TENX-like protein n=1 Tax=Mya arenaria TaxID=6604 RepID=A0ABY7FXC4_MYAAR|nr:TENX-like protein [Mya arenaria]
MSSGGGGGGYITISFTSGFVDDRDITSFGGSTPNGENGAAGVIYIENSGDRKAIIKSDSSTDCVSTLGVPTNVLSVDLDELQVTGPGTSGFQGRNSLPALSANVGTIKGNDDSVVIVSKNVVLYWGTRVGIVNSLSIGTNVHVAYGGKIDLPKTVVIDKGWWLDVCGTVSTSTDTLTIRENGELKMSYPASDLQIHSLVVDYQGVMTTSAYCPAPGSLVTLALTFFNKTAEFSLDTSAYYLSKGTQGTVSAAGAALDEENCPTSGKLTLKRTQYCIAKPGTSYSFTTLTISPGAEIRLKGSETGSGVTTITASNINIMFGGSINGVGKGFQSSGTGAATSGKGATHGGSGVSNTLAVYGNIKSPTSYGSNGAGATTSSGRGGGQIKLVVTNTLTIDGTIDVSSDTGGAGSGGSIWVQAKTITGDGYMKAEGNLGGGGGRIAAVASTTYSFTGTASARGADDASGNTGSSGTVYTEQPGSNNVLVEGKSTEKTSIKSSLDRLTIANGATVQIDSSVTIGELISEEDSESTDVCMLIVPASKTLTATSMGDADKGFSCDIDISDEGALVVSGDLIVTGNNPNLNLEGSITATSLTIDNHGSFTVAATGKVYISTLILSAWSVTTVAQSAVFGNDVSKFSVDNFEIGYEANITFAQSDLSITSTSISMDSLSQLIIGVDGAKKKLTVDASEITMQDGAVIDLRGGGDSSGASGSAGSTMGASYGGIGGYNSTASTYGSATNPTDYGSGTSDAYGGGVLSITVSGTAELDGTLTVNGHGSTSTGGASGGSIYIEATTLQGHGKLSANGGESNATDGGGGGGGRIAIIATTLTSFLGSITAYGGKGVGSAGAAGTIYKEYQQSGGAQFKTVTINNNDELSESYTHVSSITSITDLIVNGYGQVKFDGNATITIDKISGDYTGTLTIGDGQTYTIATSYGTLSPYALMCKVLIEDGGMATLPSKILLTDDDSTGEDWFNLEIYGTVIGVREMTVSSGGKVLIHSKSRSGLDTSNLKPVGTLAFNKIDVTTDAVFELSLDSMDLYTLSMVKELNVKYGGTVKSRNLFISSPAVEIAYGGQLSVNGGNSNAGDAAGNGGTSGAGGTHGGKGGDSADSVTPVVDFNGLFNQATEFGSAGGDGSTETGALGGGFLKLEVNSLLNIEGTISADGGDAEIDAGGGSGGAIHIAVINDMTGSGMISVKGGSATSGGGGGGGRIFIDVDGDYHFLGDFRLCGGSSTSAQAGGSGTAYTIVQEAGSPGYVDNFYFDNACATGVTPGVSYINVTSADIYTVNRLIMGASTRVWLYTANVHFKAKTLTCGAGSTVIVGDDTIFSPDYELVYSAITCSFDLKPDGELRLPKSVELKGEASSLEGILSNIQNLIISSYQKVTLSANARTGVCCDSAGQHTSLTEKGEYSFSKFTLESFAEVVFEKDPSSLKGIQFVELELQYGAVLRGESLDIKATSLLLHPGSTLTLNGGGYMAESGPGAGAMDNNIGTGAGHGAPGGSYDSAVSGGVVYDNTRLPVEAGSGGGNTLEGSGGSGGGYLKLFLYSTLKVDGVLQVNGASGNGTNTGGGSGGTIVVETPQFTGTGLIEANGGDGDGSGGGGAGGRISLVVTTENSFSGEITAYGAGNDDNLNTVKAGPGTTYIRTGKSPKLVHSLTIIGDVDSSIQNQTYTYIDGDEASSEFTYDLLTLSGYVNAIFGDASTEFRLANINGDTTGTLHVTDQQKVRAAVVEGVRGEFVTNINFKIGEEAVLHVPDTLYVAGVTLDIQGTCTFNNLIVEDGGTINGHTTTFTSMYANGAYNPTSDPGSYTLVSIKLKAGSNFLLPSGEREAALNTDGKARVDDPRVPSTAHGVGKNGGAHTAAGGVGGNYTVDNASLPYGTIYKPLTPGASGGEGGQGGGYIEIKTNEIILDGILQSSGNDSDTGGGGAGGSIYIICSVALKGLGSMVANGGSTTAADAGAGSGGHIAVDMKTDSFQGTYSAGGGTSPEPHGDGGPGSIYTFSKTYGEKLVCDNINGQTDYYTTLNETSLVLNFDDVDIYKYAKLQVIKDGEPRELNIKKVNGDGTGLLEPGSLIEYDANTGALMKASNINLKFAAKIYADYFNVTSSNIDLELESYMSCSADHRPDSDQIDITTGSGVPGNGYNGGAAHGGVGGGGTDDDEIAVTRPSYNSLYNPMSAGSRGTYDSDSGMKTGGRGGGYVHLQLGNLMINDGTIAANGEDSNPTGTDGGAGSGGSVLIELYDFQGYGDISSTGGDGSHHNGGGAAGRVAIHCLQEILYEGTFTVFGGNGADDIQSAGGGTVYLKDIRNSKEYKRLLLDNKDQNSEIVFPSITYVYGTGVFLEGQTESRSVSINGRLTGIADLVLGFETLLYFGKYAHTASLNPATGGYSSTDLAGTVTFGTVDLRSFSEMKYAPDQTVKQQIARIDARFQSVISAESITIITGTFQLEAGASLTSSAIYRPDDTKDEASGRGVDADHTGTLAPSVTTAAPENVTSAANSSDELLFSTPEPTTEPIIRSAYFGTGGGYASDGGGDYDSDKNLRVAGGQYYGSLYRPTQRGSSGGNGQFTSGGNGGGYIKLQVSTDLLIDGTVSADGSHGGSDAGGGSGGGVYIDSQILEGHGVIRSLGGDGYHGGAGGRIATYLKEEIYYHGSFNSLGGSGKGHYLTAGGPGSVYLFDYRSSRQYEQLHLDNYERSWDHQYIMDELDDEGNPKSEFYFDELHLTRNASLQLKTGDGVVRSIEASKVFGDASGRVYLQADQICYLEEYQPLTKLPINLWIDNGSRAYLSPLIYILGVGEIALKWNGEMIGVRHIRIVPGRVINIKSEAMTSFVADGVLQVGTPGTFQFASMELGARADIKYDSTFRADSMEVLATDFFFEPLAQFVCQGTGRVAQAGDAVNAGAGGGHASQGGGVPGNSTGGGEAFGSVYKPVLTGSKGGGTLGGLGGGKLYIKVPAEFLLDGIILIDGADGGTGAGGGSGQFSGHGKISSIGGKGQGAAGGGAGGRIAIHTWGYNYYKGELLAYGRGGTESGDLGGPGTVLYLDGQYLQVPKPVVINEINPRHTTSETPNTNDAHIDFEHLMLNKNAMLEIGPGTESITSLNLDLVMGDRSGYLHLQNGQTVFVEYSTYATLRSSPPVNFRIDEGSNIWLSADFKVIGEQQPAMQLDGHLVGVMNLTLEEAVSLYISDTASNSKIVNAQLSTYPNGVLGIGRLAMQAEAVIDHDDHFNLESASIHMRFDSLISANQITVTAGEILMEGDAALDVSGRGGVGDIPAARGSTVMGPANVTAGVGGGHGGYGGGADHDSLNSGQPYGSYKKPQHTGSKGGGTEPGNGGGKIAISVSRSIHLDGDIYSLGGNAYGTNSGGGSGGSVYVVTQNFSGHGLVETSGGNGYAYGYGGAGGRIAVHVQWYREYTGDLVTYGGYAGNNALTTDETKNGAGGTVYTTDSNSVGIEKKETEEVNGTLVYLDGYMKLTIDNDDRNSVLGTMVMSDVDTTPYVFEFDEVEANNHVVLWIEGHDSELLVHKFAGDRTGMMHLQGNQKVFSEYIESTSGYTVAPVSYKIDSGSEIILPSTTILLGTRSDMNGLLTMVQNLTIADGANVVFSSTAQTALIEAGNYTHLTAPGNISLSHLTIQRGSEATFTEKPGNSLVLDLVKLSIKYEGLMWMNKGTINSGNGVVESLGILNVDYMGHAEGSGPGVGGSNGTYGYGAAHGGHGGAPKPDVGGTPYNSVYMSTHPGSGGGNGDGQGGRGGGYLHWIVGETLWIDGEVTLEGEDGQMGNGGGGSGGGIYIQVMNFTGFGHIDCHGGDGVGDGGGGSGGRISVHVDFANKYIGRLNVVGGLGHGLLPCGAAGTVYIQENARGPQYADIKYDPDTGAEMVTAMHRRLEIDNDDNDHHLYVDHTEPWLYTMLYEEDQQEYEFDETMLEGHSNLLIAYPDGTTPGTGSWTVEVKIHLFHGDRTGVVRVRDSQRLYVEVVESQSNETIAPCSFRIDDGSEVFFPTTTNMRGSRTVLAGQITGVEDMMIRQGSILFLSTATTALMEDRQYTMVTTPGNFTFAFLRIMAGAQAEFRDVTGLCVLTVNEFYVKYLSLLLMNFVRVDSSYAHIESQGELNMDGMGHGPEQGSGAGSTLDDADSTGVGAGHGGYGGGPGPAYGGVPYNSIYKPVEAGSGGGNGNGIGGSGGGFLEWYNGDLIEINGLLTLAGVNGEGANAGGGSGGSVFMHTTNITGHGVVAVPGGDGAGYGGGGSGGRVSVNCRYRYSYGGEYHNYGGDGHSRTVTNSHAGASGTTFKEENKRALEYRETKYDPVTNSTFFDVDHHVIHSDNRLKYTPAPTLIQDPPREIYEFDEMEITGSTFVWIYHPPGVPLVELIAHLFIGDKTGQLHIRDKQRVWVEYVESISNITEAPVSYIIDYGAEVVFPSEVHMHGTNSTFAGLVTGVHNLYIEDGCIAEFKSSANTALLENGEYYRETTNGHFIWNELHMKRGGTAGFLDVANELKVETSEIKVKYQGNLYMNAATINSTYSWIESEGIFHLNGHGYKAELGPGAGFTNNSDGYGAGHGGYGGGADPLTVSEPYGSIFSPHLYGSGGGNGSGVGGAGGGILHWITSHYFELHGLLALQGDDGEGTNAGGGSGGSLLIESMNITGHGVIDTAGGAGSGTGGGGAGGRAAIHCQLRYSFGGTFINQGGVGGSDATYENHAAAAGTTFVKNNMRPLEYIHMDNKGVASPVATMIMEDNTFLYEFNETHVDGKTRVLFYHPTGSKKVEAGDIDIESNGRFSLEGRGNAAMTGDGAGSVLNGGSYGGVGGGATDDDAYGSLFDPVDLGSGGGGSTGGAGGGFVKFMVGKLFHIDGTVDAYGTDATGSCGGGSGGTILIKAYNISGHGVLDVSGGDGSGSGYGGSGGRIAAHIGSHNLYAGQYLAHGGASPSNSSNAGGPGTIYKYESNRGPQYRELKYNPRLAETVILPEHRKLTIENGNLQTTNPAIVMEANSNYYEFEELQVEGYSYVHFYHPSSANVVQVTVHELTGNKKGMIRIQSNQQLMVNFVEATHTHLDSPCGFHVDPDGELILPSTNNGKLISETKQTTFQISYLTVEKGGLIDGTGSGHAAQEGAGSGSASSVDASGGGLASKGGPSYHSASSGAANGATDCSDQVYGSGGGGVNGGNGGGSGGRICVDLAESLRYLGSFTALGGTSSGAYHGSPGTIWVNTTMGDDVSTHLWADHANKGWGCEKHSIYVDIDSVNHFHPMRDACIHPTKDIVVEYIGGDGLGTVYIDSTISMDLAPEYTRTYIRSSLYVDGLVSFPSTVIAEQTVTSAGNIIGVEHWYSRGHTKLMGTGQSSCTAGSSHTGKYFFSSFTALSDGEFTFSDPSNYNVSENLAIFLDILHLEGQSHGYINNSCTVNSQYVEIEKQAKLDGTGRGYSVNSGDGKGCTSGCGSGGGHGGSGGSCTGCGSCAGGGTYDSNVMPTLSGSGGGICTHGHGGYGGSAARLVSVFMALDGLVSMNGGNSPGGGGGGSGGSVWIDSQYLDGWGFVTANGGSGSSDSCNSQTTHRGGGGGGGRVRTWGKDVSSKLVLHQSSVNGGSGYRSGSTGSIYQTSGNVCSNRGAYNSSTLLCECYSGYIGYDCQFECSSTTTCSGNGVCNDKGQCECNDGFVGTHCTSECHRDTDCNGNGECSTCGLCVCDPCFSGPDCSTECSGYGSCEANQCVCDDCHLGVQCESECNNHGSCDTGTGNCTCDSNWGDFKCTRKGCPGTDLDCNGHGDSPTSII